MTLKALQNSMATVHIHWLLLLYYLNPHTIKLQLCATYHQIETPVFLKSDV